MILTGGLPAYAGPDPASAWARANRGRLPQTYDGLILHSMDYRRAIFRELDPSARSRMWVEHVRRYRRQHRSLTNAQKQALDTAARAFGHATNFTTAGGTTELDHAADQVKAAFDRRTAKQIMAVLGPEDDSDTTTATADCTCSQRDDWCTNGTDCKGDGCRVIPGGAHMGCGTGWLYACTGRCYN